MKPLSLFAMHLVCLFGLILATPSLAQDEPPTSKEKRSVRAIAATIDKAGRYFKLEKYKTCRGQIQKAQRMIEELADGADAPLLDLLRPEYERLAKAHELLGAQGIELAELKPLPPPMVSGQDAISFTKTIAPILVTNCGRCHVRRNRGDFSAANYQALMDSTHVSPGMADESRLIEVIVDGDMPPNGTVSDDDLERLKTWIGQGASFDGDQPQQNLVDLVGGGPAPNGGRLQVSRPKGGETVSFGLDVAPLLIEHCAPCHIDRRNPRGNLSMANFASLIRGGDSGNLWVPGDPAASLLVRRLMGEGVDVMPPNGKLDDASIETIAKWIEEGATFDGDRQQTDLRNVARTARAAAQTHPELAAERSQLAEQNWQLIMSDVAPRTQITHSFRFYSTTTDDRLKQLADQLESVVPRIVEVFKAAPDQPLVKGNTTVFVFERRYDFNELGTMLNNRPLPDELTSFWDFTIVDAYMSVLLPRNQDPTTAALPMVQQLSALHVAQMAPGVPRWFADGAGQWAAERLYPRDERIKAWETEARDIASQMGQPGDFANGKLPEHQAGRVGYLFIKQLRADPKRFNRLFRSLREGTPFDLAFEQALGKQPAEFFSTPTRR